MKHSTKKEKKLNKRELYRKYMEKKNDNGFRHYHCPVCIKEDKLLVEGIYNESDGHMYCPNCNDRWTWVS